jgi:hypothetical protein
MSDFDSIILTVSLFTLLLSMSMMGLLLLLFAGKVVWYYYVHRTLSATPVLPLWQRTRRLLRRQFLKVSKSISLNRASNA